MSNILFYFTGTGNGLLIARTIAEELGDTRLVNIAGYNGESVKEAERVGFVFPVYFAGLPGIAHEFLKKLVIEGDPYLFSVANCGGSNGPIHSQIAEYLKMKGKTLASGFTIVMPDNYIPIYKVTGEKEKAEILQKARNRINEISQLIKQKSTTKYEVTGSALFKAFGRPFNAWFVKGVHKRDKGFHVSDACIGCGKCSKACSISNISMKNKQPVWNGNCEFCLACIHVCPEEAINYKKSTLDKGRYQAPAGW